MKANHCHHTIQDRYIPLKLLRPPPVGLCKINVYGALKNGDSIHGVSVAIRNECGDFIGACVNQIQASYEAKQTEPTAAIGGLRFALDMRYNCVMY